METHKVITDKQHGFTSKRSCLSNLLINLDEITSQLDDDNLVDQVYLDLQKAFDKVPHQRLLYKLQKYGINGNLLCWVESFLSHRHQRVKVNGSYSNWSRVLSGVPQGSVLGPILFLLYINDLTDNIKYCSCSIFADDTKLAGCANNVEQADCIQEDLNSIHKWCQEWLLSFNKKKCHLLHFGKKDLQLMYHLNGELIAPVEEEKDLGVVITKDLKPAAQIKECVKKANKAQGMIKRTFSYLDKTMMIQLYKVFVRPHLEYCQQIWSPHLQQDIDELETVQRRATKLIPSLENLSYEERLKELNLYSLRDRRMRGDLILMYRIMSGDVKIAPEQLFKMESYNRTRGHDLKVHINKVCKTSLRQNFFTERVSEPWNALPSYVINSNTVDQFKHNYDKWSGIVVG